MIISEDTQAVVEYLDQYCQNNLRKKNDISTILELAAQQLNAELVVDLSFHGSAMWKVFGVMRKSTPGSEGFALLEEEFANAMNSIRTHLLAVSQSADDEVKQRFHEVYLDVHAGAIRNLCDLAHDLAQFKELQNHLKRGEG